MIMRIIIDFAERTQRELLTSKTCGLLAAKLANQNFAKEAL
jgi:hypothetical protein